MAGAAALVVGCGGVLGTALDPAVSEAIAPVACAIANASTEDGNYTSAITNAEFDIPFEGDPRDDLDVPARRIAIFTARTRELAAAREALDALAPGDQLGKQLVAAGRQDLDEVAPLIAFDLKWAPGDPKAPEPPSGIPTRLAELILEQRPDVREKLSVCVVPADLKRRTAAYTG